MSYFPQQTMADCGAACLQSVLTFFGHSVDSTDLRRRMGLGRDGANAGTLLRAARLYGLHATLLPRLEPDDLSDLPTPAILHWDFRHYVVLERCGRRGAAIVVDPARGRVRIDRAALDEHFTGVALCFAPGPDFRRSPPRPSILFSYLRRSKDHGPVIAGLFLVTIGAQLLLLAGAKATQVLIDVAIPLRLHGLPWLVLAGMVLVAAVSGAFVIARARLLIYLRTQLDFEWSAELYRHVLGLPFAFFERKPTGDIVVRVAGIAVVRDLVSTRLSAALFDAVVCVGLGLAITLLLPVLGVLVCGLGAARIGTAIWYQRRRQELLAENLRAQGNAQSAIIECVTAALTVKASGTEERAFERWRRGFVHSLNSSAALARINARADLWSTVLGILSPTAVLCLCVQETLRGRLTVGETFGLLALTAPYFATMSSIALGWEVWQQAFEHVQRIRDLYDEPPEQASKGRTPPRFSGRVTIADVSFRYSGDAPWILSNVSLRLPRGSFVAIVGPSGSGKSTLVKLVLALYKPTQGSITFDDHVPDEYDLSLVRQQIGSVVQEMRLFSGSIRANIVGPENSISEERMVAAARIAEIHDEIMAMPMAYDTMLAEGASNLSGGQRQRVAIAKAIVTAPSLVVFDEATSALDAVLEEKIFANIGRLGMTRLVVAHRMSTIQMADTIVVLSGGRVVEVGCHADLVHAGGAYSLLTSRQQSRVDRVETA